MLASELITASDKLRGALLPSCHTLMLITFFRFNHPRGHKTIIVTPCGADRAVQTCSVLQHGGKRKDGETTYCRVWQWTSATAENFSDSFKLHLATSNYKMATLCINSRANCTTQFTSSHISHTHVIRLLSRHVDAVLLCTEGFCTAVGWYWEPWLQVTKMDDHHFLPLRKCDATEAGIQILPACVGDLIYSQSLQSELSSP